MSENVSGNRIFGLENALLVGVTTFLGYAMAYMDKVENLMFYNIPVLFTQIKIEDVIFTSLSILIIGLFIGFMVLFVTTNTKIVVAQKTEYVKRTFVTDIIFFTIILILFSFLILKYIEIQLIYRTLLVLPLLILWFYVLFLIPKRFFPNQKFSSIISKYYEQINIRGKERFNAQLKLQNNQKNLIIKNSYSGYITYAITFLISLILALAIGQFSASNKQNYYVLTDGGNEYIMTSIYDNQIILVSFDPLAKVTTGKIEILPLSDIRRLEYTHTGNINAYKNKTSTPNY